ncbi:unnamed protein product [Caenorhabditis angaria]|uniref:Elongator complex protein 4 n=1 Tax=Caenorhabditis angaria TaxID=860376 RepID=A0A9P1INQ1_9PELO|nr:unnamed protein product [Caenorhabditis angaria]
MFNIGEQVQIPGCSTKKRILETSSGCPSLDTLMGGALTGSSLVLIDEVNSRYYSEFLIKYFLAEGVSQKHHCILVDPLDSSEKLRNSIPTRKIAAETPANVAPRISPEEDMKIAWRYEKIAKVSEKSQEDPWNFQNHVENPEISLIAATNFADLLAKLAELLATHAKKGATKNLMRLVIRGITSAIWEDVESRAKFLAILRRILRESWAVCYLVGCSEEVAPATWRQIESIADAHFQLKEFDEDEKKDLQISGQRKRLFLSEKFTQTSKCWHQKGFQIRVLHLPPALDDEKSTSSCQKIDF